MSSLRKDYIPVITVDGNNELDYLKAKYINAFNNIDSGKKHTVTSKDTGRIDRIAYEYYSNRGYAWKLAYYNGIVSVLDEIVPGKVLDIPLASDLDNALDSANTRRTFQNSTVTLR